MSTKMQKLRALLRKQNSKVAGGDGERFAEAWLLRHGWNYEKIEQGRFDLSKKLRDFGGKRPDFIALDKLSDDVILLDAKFHSTDTGTVFRLCDTELEKYRRLRKYCEQFCSDVTVWVLFMVFPKEFDGSSLVWVELDEFKDAPPFDGWAEPARQVSLSDRDELWCKLS